MKMESSTIEEHLKLLERVVQREKQENLAAATLTTEILNRLNVSIEAFPQKCQSLLHRTAELQRYKYFFDNNNFSAHDAPRSSETSLHQAQCDAHAISLRHTVEAAQLLETEYEVLELRQSNQALQRRIEANTRFIDDLKRDLDISKQSLSKKNPNPDTVSEHIRQTRQKLASYEEVYEKAKTKYAKLQVPECALPGALQETARRAADTHTRAGELRVRADDVALAARARAALHQLRG